jgi:glycosyltransferase involved in cell wall biosynthesis
MGNGCAIRKMKILFLTSRLPYPPHQGDKLRNWHFIQYLSKKHQVHLVSFYFDDREKQWIPTLNQVCASVTLVKLPLGQSLLNCIGAVCRKIPFQVAYYRSLRMHMEVAAAIQRVRPDIIHTHLMRMAPYVVRYQEYSKVIDFTDAVSLYLSRFKQFCRNPILRWFIGEELKRVLSYEGIMKEFDSTLICSLVDKKVLIEHVRNVRIDLINNSIEINSDLHDESIKRDPQRIIFVGNMSYPPNSDAVRYFVKEIFPLVKKEIPEAKLYIVGKNPTRYIRSLSSKDIIITGFVDNIQNEYLMSSVVVSPVRFGAGALTKVLESMMIGVPVVSTPVGVEGLQLKNGKEIFITDDQTNFAKYIINLIHDPLLWKEVSEAGKKVSRSRFKVDVVGGDLVDVYKEVVSKNAIAKK